VGVRSIHEDGSTGPAAPGAGNSGSWEPRLFAVAAAVGQIVVDVTPELVQAVKQSGRPQFLRTDNEAVLVSRLFRLGLWMLSIRHQCIEPGCPWQNGRVERFIGTMKRELATEPLAGCKHFTRTLQEIRTWYNHERPHDHLQGRTPAEVWGARYLHGETGLVVRTELSRTGKGPLAARNACPAGVSTIEQNRKLLAKN